MNSKRADDLVVLVRRLQLQRSFRLAAPGHIQDLDRFFGDDGYLSGRCTFQLKDQSFVGRERQNKTLLACSNGQVRIVRRTEDQVNYLGELDITLEGGGLTLALEDKHFRWFSDNFNDLRNDLSIDCYLSQSKRFEGTYYVSQFAVNESLELHFSLPELLT